MRSLVAGALVVLVLDGCSVSQDQEVALGQQSAAEVNAQLPIVDDASLNGFINALGDSIARTTSRSDLDWHFYIVNSDEVNAFALPGGFIYVNRGLIERMDKLDQLAGVVGHEIGHVVMRHSVKQMEQAQKANIGVTLACTLTRICESGAARAAINVGGAVIFAKHSRHDEAQADSVGVINLVRAGIDPRGIPEMFEKLLAERRARPTQVGTWFATHPLEEDRIRTTEQMIAALGGRSLDGLRDDSRYFHEFKELVHRLPAPPPPDSPDDIPQLR